MTLEGNYFISLSPVSNYSGPSCWYRRWDPLALSTVQPNPFGLYNPSPKFNPPSLVLSPRGSNPAAVGTGLSIWELGISSTSTLQDPCWLYFLLSVYSTFPEHRLRYPLRSIGSTLQKEEPRRR